MRIAVTGRHGQVATALAKLGAARGIDIIPLGRPHLDLSEIETVGPAIAACRPDIVINAAAYTDVDKAESEPDLAMAVNGDGAGQVAVAAALAGIPILQLSTDYVFDGAKLAPYAVGDAPNPVSAYGRSKLAGERLVAAGNPRHVILRTGWIYSATGRNFVRTMLGLAQTRDEVAVVADQRGCPTSADSIAAALVAISDNLLTQPEEPSRYGLFHMSGQGEATWADFAQAIFAELEARGGRRISVRRIATAGYPRPAQRPANSRLDSRLLKRVHGVELPHWQMELKRLMDDIA